MAMLCSFIQLANQMTVTYCEGINFHGFKFLWIHEVHEKSQNFVFIALEPLDYAKNINPQNCLSLSNNKHLNPRNLLPYLHIVASYIIMIIMY